MLRNDFDGKLIDENVELYFRILYGSKPMRFVEAEKGQLMEDVIFPKIKQFVDDKKYNDAEDLLFEYALPENRDILKTGILFYYELNSLSDAELEKGDFSREEIREGMEELFEIYEIEWLG